MADSSFDVVSDFDQQELVNALDQVRREVATRYDFKGAKVSLELGKEEITLHADDDFRAGSVKDLIETKAVRRGLSLKVFDWGKLEPAAGGTVRHDGIVERHVRQRWLAVRIVAVRTGMIAVQRARHVKRRGVHS